MNLNNPLSLFGAAVGIILLYFFSKRIYDDMYDEPVIQKPIIQTPTERTVIQYVDRPYPVLHPVNYYPYYHPHRPYRPTTPVPNKPVINRNKTVQRGALGIFK